MSTGPIIGTLYDTMVQFTTTLEAIKRPEAPPVCPKCGSHRTEVIGQSEGEPEKRTVRCNTCGAISAA